MVSVRKISKTKFTFVDSNSDAKLAPASLEKAKQYSIGNVFEADVLNMPKPKIIPRSRTPIKKIRRMLPRN
ncbi:hypothetical protein HY488_01330 [Candidatus Woesearchaeota archaeon]|nr:hypothetical protein [Candidatus Woesearchaeota archaeon]